MGWFVHHIFDYLFGTPAFLFIFILIAALALRPTHSTRNQARHYTPLYLSWPLLGLIGFAIFSLRAAALNDHGLQLVSENKWNQAATVFEQAAQSDPGLTLYWQNAAYAYTRAGDTQSALPLWQRAAQDDPYWVIAPATLALLQNDPTAMQAALTLAPRSDLLALNAGALNELNGDPIAAQNNYTLALKLNPATAQALFWQQTDLRKEVLLKWQPTHPAPPTSPEATIQLFQQAITDSPLNNAAYISLARAYWLTGDEPQAQRYRAIAQLIPVTAPEQTLQLYLFDGDWAEALGDQAGAIHAYTRAFSIVNDYTYSGPGTYGYPQRYWNIYHRPTPPSDLIPQFNRAVITPELETRFAKLARWLTQEGDTETACFILARIFWEAPQSASGQSWKVNCSPAR